MKIFERKDKLRPEIERRSQQNRTADVYKDNHSEIRFQFSSNAAKLCCIEKLSVTLFMDYPRPGTCTAYIEGLFSADTPAFIIDSDSSELKDVKGFYDHKEACMKIISGYSIEDSTTYKQELDGSECSFYTPKPEITLQSNDGGRTRYLVKAEGNGHIGVWLKLATGCTPFNSGKTQQRIVVETERLEIKKFYPWVALPYGFRLSSNPSESAFQLTMNDKPTTDVNGKPSGALNQVFVGADWPLFNEWKPAFLNKNAVGAKDKIDLRPGMKLSLNMTAVSEKRIIAFQSLSFKFALAATIFLGVAANYTTDVLFRLVEKSCTAQSVSGQHPGHPDRSAVPEPPKQSGAESPVTVPVVPVGDETQAAPAGFEKVERPDPSCLARWKSVTLLILYAVGAFLSLVSFGYTKKASSTAG